MLLLPQIMGDYYKKTWGSQVQGTLRAASRPFPIPPFLGMECVAGLGGNLISGSSLPHMMEQRQGWLLSSQVWLSSHCFWQEHLPVLDPVINHSSMVQSRQHPLESHQLSSTDTDTESTHLTIAYSDAIMGDTEIPNRSWDFSELHILTTK